MKVIYSDKKDTSLEFRFLVAGETFRCHCISGLLLKLVNPLSSTNAISLTGGHLVLLGSTDLVTHVKAHVIVED